MDGIRLKLAADKAVWRSFPLDIASLVCAATWTAWGSRAASEWAIGAYIVLALLRTSIPLGINLQSKLADLFLLTANPWLDLAVWIVIGVQAGQTFRIGLLGGLLLAGVAWLASAFLDSVVRLFLPIRNPYNL